MSLQLEETNGEEVPLDISLFQLIDAFTRIVERSQPGSMHMAFRHEKWSIREKSQLIISLLKDKGEILFEEIFNEYRKVPEFIVTFLALLELVHIGLVKVFQTSIHSDIRLSANFDADEPDAIAARLNI